MLISLGLLKAALDQSPAGVMLCQEHRGQFLIVYASSQLCQLAGRTPDQLLGQNWDCFLNDNADPSQIQNLLSRMEQRQPGQQRIKNHRSDGSSHWLDVHLTPLKLDDGSGYSCLTWSDISQKVATEHKLIGYKRDIERLKYKIEALTPRDSLTQLLNKTHFEQRALQEWKRAIREQRYVTLMLLDIDYFRNYNFTYGKPQGDLLLKTLAGLSNNLFQRPSDLIARYGGEEFILMLQDVGPEQAPKTAELLRQQIVQEQIPFTISPLSPFVTVSIGLACAQPSPDLAFEHLLEATDTALTKAKLAGRNRAESYLF